MIKAILLDVDNTLIDFNKGAEWSMRKCFDEFNLEMTEDVISVFHKINDELWRRLEKGKLTKPELHKIRWQTIFDELGIKADGPVFEQKFIEYVPQAGIPVDGAKELLDFLYGKYIICYASNSSKSQQMIKLTKSDMLKYADHLFISDEIGYAKPAKEYFEECMARLSPIKKEEVILIGDSLTADIEGGLNFGIKTIWFDYLKKGDSGEVKPDYTVKSLDEIKSLLLDLNNAF